MISLLLACQCSYDLQREICAVENMSKITGMGVIHKQLGNAGRLVPTFDQMHFGMFAAQLFQGYGDILEFSAGGDTFTVAAPDGGDHEYVRLGIKSKDFMQESLRIPKKYIVFGMTPVIGAEGYHDDPGGEIIVDHFRVENIAADTLIDHACIQRKGQPVRKREGRVRCIVTLGEGIAVADHGIVVFRGKKYRGICQRNILQHHVIQVGEIHGHAFFTLWQGIGETALNLFIRICAAVGRHQSIVDVKIEEEYAAGGSAGGTVLKFQLPGIGNKVQFYGGCGGYFCLEIDSIGKVHLRRLRETAKKEPTVFLRDGNGTGCDGLQIFKGQFHRALPSFLVLKTKLKTKARDRLGNTFVIVGVRDKVSNILDLLFGVAHGNTDACGFQH